MKHAPQHAFQTGDVIPRIVDKDNEPEQRSQPAWTLVNPFCAARHSRRPEVNPCGWGCTRSRNGIAGHKPISEQQKPEVGVYYQPLAAPTLWQKRYYDHNIRNYASFVEKLRYIHRNPVKRGLVNRPEDWKWSSFRHYATAEIGAVEMESQWTADRRNGRTPHVLHGENDR